MISVMSPSSSTMRSMLVTWTLLPSLSVAVAGSFGAVSVATAAAGEPPAAGEAARVGEAVSGEAAAVPVRGVPGEAATVPPTVVAAGCCVAAVLLLLPALLVLLLQATKAAHSSTATSGRRARGTVISGATPAERMVRTAHGPWNEP